MRETIELTQLEFLLIHSCQSGARDYSKKTVSVCLHLHLHLTSTLHHFQSPVRLEREASRLSLTWVRHMCCQALMESPLKDIAGSLKELNEDLTKEEDPDASNKV